RCLQTFFLLPGHLLTHLFPVLSSVAHVLCEPGSYLQTTCVMFESVCSGTDSKYSGRVKHLCDKNSCFLRITDLRQRDSAVYRFRFITNHPGGRFTGSPGVTLTVTVSPSEIVEGSSVNLTCSSDANPAANYTWYKENEESPKASGQIFTITDIRAEHSGNYYCEVQNSVGRHNNTLHLTVVETCLNKILFENNVYVTSEKKKTSKPAETPEPSEQVKHKSFSRDNPVKCFCGSSVLLKLLSENRSD
uniref:Ig-like domain-containing protein n=1 Tax=Anabas testudineus TaxID=64144 RepID=A0A3Q1H1F1_ANATE